MKCFLLAPPSPPPSSTGLGREMIVVVDDLSGPSPCVGDDVLSEREVKDLNRGERLSDIILNVAALCWRRRLKQQYRQQP